MRKYREGLYIVFLFCLGTVGAYSQSCVSSNNNTVINFSCGQNCGNVNLRVPDLRTTSDYAVTTIPYNPYPYTTPFGNELTALYQDDVYSAKISLPFQFCFYDSVFSKVVVGSNGLITFDTMNANCFNAWNITPIIPYAFGTQCPPATQQGTAYYPRASVMGAYSDLDPRFAASPSDRKIECRVEGAAPCRRFITSYYHIGVFGNTCGYSTPNTFQIVLYESTGIIEIFFEQKACFSGTNSGKAVLGVQDWTQTRARAAAGKNASQWNVQNEAYQFIPSGGASRFINSQLFTMGGSMVATATTSFAIPGSVGLIFPNICPSGNSEQFVVRTSYTSCADPNTILITQDTITINKTATLGATAVVTDLNCTTGSSGTITVTVPNSGAAPFQYSINGGPSQGSNVFTGLAVGSYTVFVTDINGCSSTLNVTVNRTGILGVGYTSINSACSGLNTGSITILPPSVYTPLQYSLNGGPPQTSNIFTGLAAGTYTISVTDAIGCTGSTNVTITQGGGVSAIFGTTPTSCSGTNNGSIVVMASGGTLPYQYSLNGGALQSGNVFSGLAAGTYSIRVVDANGCNSTYPVTVNPGAPLNATVIKTNVSCNGGADGKIIVNVSNGAPPYQYSLDNVTWQTSNVFTGLAPGTYTVYYRDNNACSNSQIVTITQPAGLNATLTSQSPSCFGLSDGRITVTASGGTPIYLYSLDGISYQGSPALFNIAAGTVTVYIKDANGCIITRNIIVTQPSPITTAISVVDADCNGAGQIIATPSGGVGPYGYGLPASPPPLSYNDSIFNVGAGVYNVLVIDANGCANYTQNIIVALTNNLAITASPDITICEGTSTQLNVNANATQFSWTPAAGLSNANIKNPVANPTVTTQYIVTATYGQCNGKDTIIVNVNAAPIPDAGPDVEICYGQDYILQGSGGVQFIWTPSSTLSNGALPNPLSTPAQTTTYSLNVIDANGCSSLTPDPVVITVTPPIIVKTFPSDTVVFSGDKFQLLATSGATNYTWNPPVGLSDPFIANPVLTVTSDMTFNITAKTAAGCRGDGTVNVKVFRGPEIYMPTGFTPNGDGKNDIFKPFTVGITRLNYFKVYNRWGQLLYSTADMNEGWDGRTKGTDQHTSTYVWMVQGVARDGRVMTKKGTVTLIR